MSEKLDKEKCLCYLRVKGGQVVNRGKWGGSPNGFSVSSDYSFCAKQCIHAAGGYTFNFPDDNEFVFNNTDDWTVSFYVLKTANAGNSFLVYGGGTYYSIQLADAYSNDCLGARFNYVYTHKLETHYDVGDKYHAAFVHTAKDNLVKLYLNGKLQATYTWTGIFPVNKQLGIFTGVGAATLGDQFYIDELIITPQALWTEDFTPTYRYLWGDTKKIYLTDDNVAYAKV